VQSAGESGKADISFTVPQSEVRVALDCLEASAEALGADTVTHDPDVAKVSVVGIGMAMRAGVAHQAFQALADENINIQMITTSEIKISMLVERDEAKPALRHVHQVFKLDEEPPVATDVPRAVTVQPVSEAIDVLARLHGLDMEELIVEDVTLDTKQATVTIRSVPNEPGIASKVFAAIAGGGVFVDMIVQSHGRAGHANVSFTVPRHQLDHAVAISEKLVDSFDGGSVVSNPHVAKLSVSGIGLRSHTGVATRMFQALAKVGINVEMINTSEVRVNVVVAGPKGEEGLMCLKGAFADALR